MLPNAISFSFPYEKSEVGELNTNFKPFFLEMKIIDIIEKDITLKNVITAISNKNESLKFNSFFTYKNRIYKTWIYKGTCSNEKPIERSGNDKIHSQVVTFDKSIVNRIEQHC